MQIRTRLTLQFLLLGGMIMIFASAAIYFSSAGFRKEEFYNRLRNKARNTAKLILNANEFDTKRVLSIEKNDPVNLPNEKIIILNFLNDKIYNTDDKGEIAIRNDIVERIRLYEKISYRQGPYEVLGTLYTERLNRYVVIAAATDIEGFLYLKKLKNILTFVCLGSLALFSIAGWIYSGRALKPISDLVKKAEDISITSLNLRVNEGNGTDEIGRLAKTFNKMLGRLETSFAMQKDFIANASHELRTPLTSINGQLEVLMMKDRSTAEYKSALESVLDDIKSLIDLSNRLLLIARTSTGSPESFSKRLRIDEILWQAREEMKRFNSEFHISISLNDSLTDSDQMVVVGDESLLKVAVSNLMDNACKYSPDHSVDIKLNHTENMIEISFTDKGIGISEEDLKKVFEPFYRGANTISISGTGIGLPLVSQIIKNHNGSIRLSSQLNKGTTVIVSLPGIV